MCMCVCVYVGVCVCVYACVCVRVRVRFHVLTTNKTKKMKLGTVLAKRLVKKSSCDCVLGTLEFLLCVTGQDH